MEFHAAVINKEADLRIDVESSPNSATGNRQELNYIMQNSSMLLKTSMMKDRKTINQSVTENSSGK